MSISFETIANQFKRLLAHRRFGKQLRLVVDRTAQYRNSDVLLVACMRDELARLPFFCDYYRKLGVNQFLLIDNDSSDGIIEWAKGQPDVSVWHTKASYKASKFGMEWCNHLLREYGIGHLCVTVDPDELLVYPCMETRNLRDLGEFMKMEKRDVLHCVMLDAYSDKPLSETIYAPMDNPFEVCPYFDKDGYIQMTAMHRGYTRGGPRMRVHNVHHPEESPALNKIPVVWWQRHYRYTSSMHDLLPARLGRVAHDVRPAITGALFHFKFISSLADKAAEEMIRKQHYNAGQEYQRYVETHNPMFYEVGLSARYESPEQLIRFGLISRGNWI